MMMSQLLEYMAKRGHSVTVAALGAPETVISRNGVLAHRRRGKERCRDLGFDADVVITHLGASMWAKELGKYWGVPVVQLIHNTSKFTSGFLGSGCDFAVYNSEWVKVHHEATKPKIIQMWMERGYSVGGMRTQDAWQSIVCRPPALEKIRSLGRREGKVTLVNLTPNKGPDVFYGLAEANPGLEFQAVRGGYEPESQDVRILPNVTHVPHTLDIDSFYSEASVILMPSMYESYGMVAMEAMSRGIPVLVSGTPGLRECIGSGGWIIEDRENLESWQVGLDDYLADYDHAVAQSHARYAELQEQTKQDLEVFEETMNEVACGTYSDIRHRSRSR